MPVREVEINQKRVAGSFRQDVYNDAEASGRMNFVNFLGKEDKNFFIHYEKLLYRASKGFFFFQRLVKPFHFSRGRYSSGIEI